MSSLDISIIIDKIKGMIYGQALGDAYGLATEFKDKQWIQANYKNQVIPFPDFITNEHNCRWELGDWTDDTDQMICIMEMYNQHQGVNVIDFAARLYRWHKKGFTELGDKGGMGIGATIYQVLNHPNFLSQPHDVALAITKQTGSASNGALMRTCITSAFHINDIDKVIEDTLDIAKVTHFHPKVLASCVYMTCALNDILTKGNVDVITCLEQALVFAEDKKEFYDVVTEKIGKFADVGFDSPNIIGYVFLCLKAFIIGSQVKLDKDNLTASFKNVLHTLIRQGGDADTNAAVCGAALGARVGYNNLPAEWLSALPHKAWLDEKVETFIKSINW